VGELAVGLDDGVVERDGEPIALTRTEFRLLAELVMAGGRILSREDLLEKVWGYGYFGDSRIVDVHIRRLRTKVERDPASPRHVVTARGLGYRVAG
jgi:DNA-binding response OmpR family regulator